MNNSLLTPTIITKESLTILENNLVAANRVNRKFENQFVKIGSSLTIRKPNRFTVNSGAGLAIEDIAEPSVSITVSNQKHVDFQFSSQDLTLVIEEFSERYLKPAMASLANQVDYDVLSLYSGVSNLVGTPGTTPSAFSSSVQLVGRRMDDNAAPQDMRNLVINPNTYWTMAAAQVGLFVMPTAKDALTKGYLNTLGNYEIYMDQNVQSLQTGTHVSTNALVAANGQTGSNISTVGWAVSDTFLVGEVVTFGTVNNINPQSRQSTGVLKNFVITSSTTVSATSTAVLAISPAIVTSGPYQNVSNAPVSTTAGAVSILSGTSTTTYPQNVAFCRDAFGLVMVPMEIPQGVDFAARELYKNISMRTIRAYDINNDVFPTRIDILYGTANYYDELACRLTA